MPAFFRITIESNRIFGLDILRALAILFVVVEHGGYLLPEHWRHIVDFIVFDGVSIFFVLSGFLIGGILIRIINRHGINKEILFNFWVRRWFRTLPNYFFILLLLCFLHFFFTDHFTFLSVYKYFLFSQNLFQQQPSWFFPEAWSLSVEEWFYLLIPVLIAFFLWVSKANHRQVVLIIAISIIVIVTIFRFYRYVTLPIDSLRSWDLLFRKQVITRLDSIMYGVVGAYISFYYYKLWSGRRVLLLFLGIFLFLLSKFVIPLFTQVNNLYSSVFSFSLISLATLLLLPYLSDLKTSKGLLAKAITYISLISYSMYLLNLSIIQYWIINKIPWTELTDNSSLVLFSKNGLYWVLLISLSIILYKYFELPMTKLRDFKMIKSLCKAV